MSSSLCALQLRRYLNPIPPPSVPSPFPADLDDPDESPNIYVTQPTTIAISAFPPSALSNVSSLHSLSPASSPTTADFPPTAHIHSHSLLRQHSFPHNHTHSHAPYGTSPSPVPMDFECPGPKTATYYLWRCPTSASIECRRKWCFSHQRRGSRCRWNQATPGACAERFGSFGVQ
jgi:hypothetical protein